MQLTLTITVLIWLAATVFTMLTCGESKSKFQLANLLSFGTLGIIFQGRLPSQITMREKFGVLFLLAALLAAVVATLIGVV